MGGREYFHQVGRVRVGIDTQSAKTLGVGVEGYTLWINDEKIPAID